MTLLATNLFESQILACHQSSARLPIGCWLSHTHQSSFVYFYLFFPLQIHSSIHILSTVTCQPRYRMYSNRPHCRLRLSNSRELYSDKTLVRLWFFLYRSTRPSSFCQQWPANSDNSCIRTDLIAGSDKATSENCTRIKTSKQSFKVRICQIKMVSSVQVHSSIHILSTVTCQIR